MSQAAHTQRQDVVLQPSQSEWDDGVQRALDELGLTYADLRQQALSRDFQSPEAMNLWVIIGEPLRRAS